MNIQVIKDKLLGGFRWVAGTASVAAYGALALAVRHPKRAGIVAVLFGIGLLVTCS